MTDWNIIVGMVAVYAAIVSTAALLLEIRRWIESGPRLSLNARAPMITINLPATEGKQLMSLIVINRGTISTTLNTMILAEYPTFWHRWLNKPKKAAIIANPSLDGHKLILPKIIKPGEEWTGFGNYEELKEWLETGNLYVGIYASHKDRPITTRIKIVPKANLVSDDGDK